MKETKNLFPHYATNLKKANNKSMMLMTLNKKNWLISELYWSHCYTIIKRWWCLHCTKPWKYFKDWGWCFESLIIPTEGPVHDMQPYPNSFSKNVEILIPIEAFTFIIYVWKLFLVYSFVWQNMEKKSDIYNGN